MSNSTGGTDCWRTIKILSEVVEWKIIRLFQHSHGGCCVWKIQNRNFRPAAFWSQRPIVTGILVHNFCCPMSEFKKVKTLSHKLKLRWKGRGHRGRMIHYRGASTLLESSYWKGFLDDKSRPIARLLKFWSKTVTFLAFSVTSAGRFKFPSEHFPVSKVKAVVTAPLLSTTVTTELCPFSSNFAAKRHMSSLYTFVTDICNNNATSGNLCDGLGAVNSTVALRPTTSTVGDLNNSTKGPRMTNFVVA